MKEMYMDEEVNNPLPIEDSKISKTSVWSSSKINDEISEVKQLLSNLQDLKVSYLPTGYDVNTITDGALLYLGIGLVNTASGDSSGGIYYRKNDIGFHISTAMLASRIYFRVFTNGAWSSWKEI